MTKLIIVLLIISTRLPECFSQSFTKLELGEGSHVGIKISHNSNRFTYLKIGENPLDLEHQGFIALVGNSNEVIASISAVNFIEVINDSVALVIDKEFSAYLFDFESENTIDTLNISFNDRFAFSDFHVGRYKSQEGFFYRLRNKICFYAFERKKVNEILTLDSFDKKYRSFVSFTHHMGSMALVLSTNERSFDLFTFDFDSNNHKLLTSLDKSHTLSYEPLIDFVGNNSVLFSHYTDAENGFLTYFHLRSGEQKQYYLGDLKVLSIASNRNGENLISLVNESEREIQLPLKNAAELISKIFTGIDIYSFEL